MLAVLLAVAIVILIIATFKYPPLSLALFLTTASVKGVLTVNFAIFRHVDYTVLCAVLVLIAMSYSFLKSGSQLRDLISVPVGIYLLIAIIVLFSVSYTSAPTYGLEKSISFATFGLIAFLAPIIFDRDMKDSKLMIWILLVSGVAIAVITIVAPQVAIARTSVATRASFLESDTLSTASRIGWAVIILFVFMIMKRTSFRIRMISIITVPIAMAGMIMTDSRGPFIGVILVLIIAVFICRRGVSKTWQPFIFGVFVASLLTSFTILPEQFTTRIRNLWKSSYDFQEATVGRTVRFSWTLSHSFQRPILGHGAGSWAVDNRGVDEREYPHNIILEFLYEQGVIGAILITLLFGLIFKRWRQASKYVSLYGMDMEIFQMVHIGGLLFLYSFLQAMKTGDIVDGRWMFFCAGMIVASFNLVRSASEKISLDNEFASGGLSQLDEPDFE